MGDAIVRDTAGAQPGPDEMWAVIHNALLTAATELDKDDGNATRVAFLCRNLPTDTVDLAFSSAVLELIRMFRDRLSSLSDVFSAAEQFVHMAGRDRFSMSSRGVILAAMSDEGPLSTKGTIADPGALAAARAFAHGLLSGLGMASSFEEVSAETLMRDHAPALWLDLVRDNLSPSTFVAFVAEALRARRLRPAELLPRLRSIVARQGPASAQSALNAACRLLYSDLRYDEAVRLIETANVMSPSNFRLPVGENSSIAVEIESVDQLVDRFCSKISGHLSEPYFIYEELRKTLDPLLCESVIPDEEARRRNWRMRLAKAIRASPRIEEYKLLGMMDAISTRDVSQNWWWLLILREVGRITRQADFHELASRMPRRLGPRQRQERSHEVEHTRLGTFEIDVAAMECGFG